MRYKIADLITEVPAAGGMSSRCKDYLTAQDKEPDIVIRADLYDTEKWKPLPEDRAIYMESGFQFYRQLLRFNGIMLHASAIEMDGWAYLFSGPSGVGKSTHTALWLDAFGQNANVINDDKPAIRFVDAYWFVYGTPWSGKTQCYKNICRPLGGIVRLQQAPYNRFEPSDAMGAFIALMPGCAIIKQDRRLYNSLCDTLTIIAEREHIGIMKCLPDEDAAKTCREGLMFLPPKGCRNKKKH